MRRGPLSTPMSGTEPENAIEGMSWKMPLGVMFGLEGPRVRLCGNDSKTMMSSFGDTGCPSSQSENRDAYGHLCGLENGLRPSPRLVAVKEGAEVLPTTWCPRA